MEESAGTRDVIEAQLVTIEQAWGIRIANRAQLRDWIGDSLTDPAEILSLTTSLNTWMALNQPEGSVQVSRALFEQILLAIHRRREGYR
ncbi:MAG: hypothetical protein LUQ64_03525 [Methanomicrobiales archaeon]|nr:hypothetical protein [Methanomicrobiales archaeon]